MAFRGQSDGFSCINAAGNNYFRSHDEGNLLGIVKLLSTENKELGAHLLKCSEFDLEVRRRGRGSRLTFLSDRFVNTVLNATKASIVKEIVNEINASGGKFGLLFDSTTDAATKHQTSIVIRYLNSKWETKESTLAVCEQSASTGKDLFRMIDETLKKNGLSIENAVGFSTDGAQNNRSTNVGFRYFIQRVNLLCLYVWCVAHRANLFMSKACKGSLLITLLLAMVEEVGIFFRASHKRMDIWTSAVISVPNYNNNSRLKLIGQTRWTSKQDALKSIMSTPTHFFVVIKALVMVCNSERIDGSALNTACRITNSFIVYSNIVSLYLMHQIFSEITPVMKFLQKRGLHITEASKKIKQLFDSISEFDISDASYTAVDTFIADVNGFIAQDNVIHSADATFTIQVPNDIQKQAIKEKLKADFRAFCVQLKENIEEMFINDVLGDDQIFQQISYLDLSDPAELSRNESKLKLDRICKWVEFTGDPSIIVQELKDFVAEFHGREMSESLMKSGHDLSAAGNDDLFLPMAHNDIPDENDEESFGRNGGIITKCSCIECILKYIQSTGDLSNKYRNIFLIYKYIALLPSTQVKCESDFSRLKYIKNCRRTNITSNKLQNLLIIAAESNMLSKVPLDDIIDNVAISTQCLASKIL